MNDRLTPTDRELIQENILMHCYCASRKGIPFHVIVEKVQNYGYDVEEDDVDQEIRYLEGKKFIYEVTRPLSPENRRYLSTSEGTDYLRARGFFGRSRQT